MQRLKDGAVVYRVHYSAHPERGQKWAREECRKYSSQAIWEREQEMVHAAGGGERLFAGILAQWENKVLIDPAAGFEASPYWKRFSGFDHGKASATAALVAAIDGDYNIYVLSEYYQPNLSPKEHRPNLEALEGFLDSMALADPTIFDKTQAQGDGTFKSIAELYEEEGISNLVPAPKTSEIRGMERILRHWVNLDRREPTLRIVCPRRLRDISAPMYGLRNEGCPNLLWELRRARTEDFSTTKATGKVVDRDNDLRDCLKYLCLALPEPRI
jgi:hypothetical protein